MILVGIEGRWIPNAWILVGGCACMQLLYVFVIMYFNNATAGDQAWAISVRFGGVTSANACTGCVFFVRRARTSECVRYVWGRRAEFEWAYNFHIFRKLLPATFPFSWKLFNSTVRVDMATGRCPCVLVIAAGKYGFNFWCNEFFRELSLEYTYLCWLVLLVELGILQQQI